MFVTRNEVDLMYVLCISIQRYIILLKFYREVDDGDEGGGDDGEEFEDGEQLPPESDSDESEDEV